jgi:hypothetical protein
VTEQPTPDGHSPTLDAIPTVPEKSQRLPGKPLWWLVGGAVALGALAITLILTLAGGGKDLTVKFSLIDFEGVSCSGGTGGYGDVGPGMDVVVRDNDGKVIGTSALGDNGEEVEGIACEWTAVVEDLPSGEDYYAVTVGRRGEQVYSGDELDEKEWEIALSLGGSQPVTR